MNCPDNALLSHSDQRVAPDDPIVISPFGGAQAWRAHPEVQQVLAEFAGVFDDWEVAEWFATPNLWLADRLPAEMLGRDPQAVVGAARADRLIAVG